MNWTRILLDNETVKEGGIKKLQSKFRDIFHKNGLPVEMGLFEGKPLDNGDHPYYLTPACSKYAQGLIGEYSGISCEKPVKSGQEPTLVIGFNKSWELLKD